MKRAILFLIFGALGGFIGWAVLEPMPFTHIHEKNLVELYRDDAIFGAIMGFFMGGAMGVAFSLWQGRRLSRFAVSSALLGMLGGSLGLVIGERVFQMLVPTGEDFFSLLPTLQKVVARSIGWLAVGAVVGWSMGLITRSKWRAKRGAIGGAIGGFIGGLLFDFLPFIFYTDAISRMVALTSIGGLVGFASALAEELTKKAWIKVLSGRKEGKEYIVDKDEFYIGRDELCDLGLFGDRTILPKHALIIRKDHSYEIRDLGGGVILNGQAVSSAILNDGDRLQIGSYTLLFQMKEKVARKDVPVTVTPHPLPADVCPYCGQKKDPVTGACACTPMAVSSGKVQQSLPQQRLPTSSKPSLSSMKTPKLVVIKGPLQGEVYPITKEEFTIGRADDRDLKLLDRAVSRKHCKIVLEEDGYYIIDEGSTNGTFVGGMRIAREKLKSGDVIQIGESRIKFEM